MIKSDKNKIFWNKSAQELFSSLGTSSSGLNGDAVNERLTEYGLNLLKPKKKIDSIHLLFTQFKSPIILLLIFASVLSFFLHDQIDAVIILSIVFISGILGFWQERGANQAVSKLTSMVQTLTTVIRDNKEEKVPLEQVVPGDIVILSAGSIVPGDCIILESNGLFVDEAILTGETFPIEKSVGILPENMPLVRRSNCLFLGTHVVSGSSKAMVIHTGINTEFGGISEALKLRPPETEFEHGIRRFGYFLIEITLVFVILIFAFNIYFHRSILDSFLFSLALAVGLTPQLLPAIISINLSHGAKRMAVQNVIVKKLASIENFGSMDILCSDKTGTLTQGKVQIHSALNIDGLEKENVLFLAYLNASFENGFINPIDEAIRNFRTFDVSSYKKLGEIPYDFVRKRISILVNKNDQVLLVTKGALQNILSICSKVEINNGAITEIKTIEDKILHQYEKLSASGFRTLGIAYKEMPGTTEIGKVQEQGMIFAGFLTLFDPLRDGIGDTIQQLKTLGIQLKIITGDNKIIATNIGKQVGLTHSRVITGGEMRQISDHALIHQVRSVDIFAEVEPNQKERIILALKKSGNVVGYMGDGINNAPALHAADVGISVSSAVDVAKEAADIVLLKMNFNTLISGVQEGRKTFANTLKYVFMATSANFGNMFSMAGASLFLPFLPLLPKQILLTNLMTDFPEMGIASDNVDQEMIKKPRRWDIKFIRRFMATFGLVSSFFDYLTFGALLLLLHATPEQFRTGWFLESVISASLIVLVIRSREPFFKSKPGMMLQTATFAIITFVIILPFTPFSPILGFTRLPSSFFLMIGLIIILYILTIEIVKKYFYKYKYDDTRKLH
jgi:Mg2+-importing ATPase